MVITLNADDLPDWLEDAHLGVDVMFDEGTYREMEYAGKMLMQAEHSRLTELRDSLLGLKPARTSGRGLVTAPALKQRRQHAMTRVPAARDVGIVHGPPGTGKTTTLVKAITVALQTERQVLVCAPSNAAIDLLAEKLGDEGLRVLRIGHPARVSEQS